MQYRLHKKKWGHPSKGPRSPIKRTEVKRKYSLGPENQVFSPREKPLDNTPDFFAFCLSRNISFAMSAYFAAPVTHQDLGRRSSPTVLRRPDNLRSHAMSKVLLQISWLRTNPLLAHVVVGETKSSEKLEAVATNQVWWLCQPHCWFPTASKFMQNISRDQSSRPPA